eukprot:6208856-Pleurochrysis_carterae.AAC.1
MHYAAFKPTSAIIVEPTELVVMTPYAAQRILQQLKSDVDTCCLGPAKQCALEAIVTMAAMTGRAPLAGGKANDTLSIAAQH